MKKRRYRLAAMGLAMLMALQTPAMAAVQTETVQQETASAVDMQESNMQEQQPELAEKTDETQEETSVQTEQGSVKQEAETSDPQQVQQKQTEYTWSYDPQIGWQLWWPEEDGVKHCVSREFIS